MRTFVRTALSVSLLAVAMAGCHGGATVPTPDPHQNQMLSNDHDAVESFFAAIQDGDANRLSSIVTSGHPYGIGGRTWKAWINDYQNVHIRAYRMRIAKQLAWGDQVALQVLLSNGEEVTFYLVPVGAEYHVYGIDRRQSATTTP